MKEVRPTILVAHPSSDLYGSDRVLLESVEAFVAGGWNVVTVLPGNGPLVAEVEKRGADVAFCTTPVLRKSLLTPLGIIKLIQSTTVGVVQSLKLLRTYRPAVLYVSTLTIPLWPVLGRIIRKPIVTHVHEAEGSAPRILRVALTLPLALATSILANSRFSVTVLEESMPRLRGRAKVIYNGVPGPATNTAARPHLHGPVRMLYVGRLSYRKGVDVALESLVELRDRGIDAILDLVGAVYPGYESYERSLREYINRYGIEDRVMFHGFQDDIWPFLAACDVAIVPSRFDEPFGNTAVEAVLAARPLVVSNTSGLREAAEGYKSAQYCTPGSPAKLADAVENVKVNWDKYQQLAAEDAVQADRKHGTDNYRRQIEAEIRDAAGLRP